MKRYKVVDTSAFQKLNMKPGAAAQAAAAKGPPRMAMAQYHPVTPVVKHNARALIGAASVGAGLSARDLARGPVGTAIGPARPGTLGKVNPPAARTPPRITKKPGCGGDCGCSPCSKGANSRTRVPIGGFLPPASCVPESSMTLPNEDPPPYPVFLRGKATYEHRLSTEEHTRLQRIIDFLNALIPLPSDGIDPETGAPWRLPPRMSDHPTLSLIRHRRDQAVVDQFQRRQREAIWANTEFWSFVTAQDFDGVLSDLQRGMQDLYNPLIASGPEGHPLSPLMHWLLLRTAAVYCVYGLTRGFPSGWEEEDFRQDMALGVFRAPAYFVGIPPVPTTFGPGPSHEMLFPDRPLIGYAFECPPGTVGEIQWIDEAQPLLAAALIETNTSLESLRPPARTAAFYNAAWAANFRRFYCPGTSLCPGGVYWGHVVTQLIPRTRFVDPATGETLLGFPGSFDRPIAPILRCPPDGR